MFVFFSAVVDRGDDRPIRSISCSCSCVSNLKLAALLKGSGSWLVPQLRSWCENSYPVGDKVFFALCLTDDVVKVALDEAGFRLVSFESIALRQKVEGTDILFADSSAFTFNAVIK